MISVIIATYNSGRTIEKCLESVILNNCKQWECLVVDGNSTDNTVDIVKQYAEKDSRFRFISEPDKGIYDALNKGVKLSKGEWIYVLGSDDKLAEHGLEALLENSDGYDVVYGDIFAVDDNGCQKYIKAREHTCLKYRMCASHQGMIVRKSVIEKHNGFNLKYRVRADFDLIQRIYLDGGRFRHVNLHVAYFSLTGISNNNSVRKDWERYRILSDNKSTRIPMFYFWLVEIPILAKKYLRFFLK